MLHLEGRALNQHYFYAQKYGGLHILEWVRYATSLRERFGLGMFKDPMSELINLKQLGIVKQYHDLFVSLLNQLQLLASYALSVFLFSNLKHEIGQYLNLFRPQTLVEGFYISKQVEGILSNSPRNIFFNGSNSLTQFRSTTTPLAGTHKSVALPFQGTFNHLVSTTSNGFNVLRAPFKGISPTLIAERKQKGLCFLCGTKYHVGHKCVKAQLYQVFLSLNLMVNVMTSKNAQIN